MNNVEVRALQSNTFQLLSGIPITPTQQLYFNSTAERDTYFDSHVIWTFTDMKFIREHRAVKVNLNVETLEAANYMRFRNNAYNGIWMYCAIDRVEYVNPNTSLIYFTVDAWQTYFMNVEIRDCDIAREHEASGESYTANTQPEGVDFGDYRLVNEYVSSLNIGSLSGMSYVIVSTVNLISSGGTVDNPVIYGAEGGELKNLPSAAGVYYVDSSTSTIDAVISALEDYPWVSQSIVAIYPFPDFLIPKSGVFSSAMGFQIGLARGNSGANYGDIAVANWRSLLPAFSQSKLYCYPYSFVEIAMPDGASIILKPEMIADANLSIRVSGAIIPDGIIIARVQNYNGGTNENDWTNNAVSFTGFPLFPVQNDQFTLAKSQAQSMNNLVRAQANARIDFNGWMDLVGIAGNVLGGNVGSLFTGAVGTIQNLATGIFNEQQNAETARQRINMMQSAISLAGASAGGAESVMLSLSETLNIHIRFWSIRPEYQTKLQQYFDAFGYASNRIGVPNMNNRPRYNYVRCNSVNIYGNVPQEHLSTIRSMFLNGVTFWHDHDNVGTYGNNG